MSHLFSSLMRKPTGDKIDSKRNEDDTDIRVL